MVSVLDSVLSCPGSSPDWGHCIVFLGKKLYSHSASLHPDVQMGIGEFNGGGWPCNGLAYHPGENRNIPGHLMLQKLGIALA